MRFQYLIYLYLYFIHLSVYSSTNVVFSNNSSDSYIVNSQLIDEYSNLVFNEDYFPQNQLQIAPLVSNVISLKFNSNVNIKKGHEYHFQVSILNRRYPNQYLIFYITTKGLFTGSKITETSLILPSGTKVTFDPAKSDSVAIPEWNNIFLRFVPFMRSDSGVFWPSFVLAIDQPQSDPFDFSPSNTFKALTYNAQLWPIYGDKTNPPNKKRERAYRLPKLISNNYDYVTLEEVFERGLRNQIIKDMGANYPFHVDAAGMETLNILSSGVVTFSKWPILESKQYVYKYCISYDCLANKGITYIKISKTVDGIEQKYNIFSTHFQAGHSEAEKNYALQPRTRQIQEMKQFIQEQNIPSSEPVLIAGDLNVDKYETELEKYNGEYLQTEYQFLLDTLNAVDPTQTGLTYSADYKINTMLALSSTSTARIDYVLYLKDHRSPIYSINYISVMRDSLNPKMYPIYDMSDHLPAIGEFVF